MAVYKPKGKDWYMVDVYDHTGRRIRKKVGKSKKLALDVEANLKTKILQKEFLGTFDERKILFENFAKEYLKWLPANRAKRTCKRCTGTVKKHLIPRWGKVYIQDVTTKMIDDFKTERVKMVKPVTVNSDLSCIMAMFSLAKKWGYIQESPCKGAGLYFRKNKGSDRFLSYDEARIVLEGSKASSCPDLHDMVLTALHTGMRIGEIVHLQWGDIDQSQKTMRVVSREEHPTKTRESRTIPLSTALRDALKKRVRHLNSPYVFCRANGKSRSPARVSTAFTRAIAKIGIAPITFHGLRHTFASWAAMGGLDLPTLQKILGHANIQTTMRYAHLAPEHLKGAVDFLERQQVGNGPRPARVW